MKMTDVLSCQECKKGFEVHEIVAYLVKQTRAVCQSCANEIKGEVELRFVYQAQEEAK